MKFIPKKFLVPVAAVALAASTVAGTAGAVSGGPVAPATTTVTTQTLPDTTAGAAPIVATITAQAQKVIHEIAALSPEARSFAHFWCGYFYACYRAGDQ